MSELSKGLRVEEPYCRLNARMLLNNDLSALPVESVHIEKLEQALVGARENAEMVLNKFPREYYDDLVKPSWVHLTQEEGEWIKSRLKMENMGINELRDTIVSFRGLSFIVSITLYQCG